MQKLSIRKIIDFSHHYYNWRHVSIVGMRAMENNILSVAKSLIRKQKQRNYPCMVDGKCQEIAYFSSAMLRQKMQHLYQSIVVR